MQASIFSLLSFVFFSFSIESPNYRGAFQFVGYKCPCAGPTVALHRDGLFHLLK